jgi:hypothetical protein
MVATVSSDVAKSWPRALKVLISAKDAQGEMKKGRAPSTAGFLSSAKTSAEKRPKLSLAIRRSGAKEGKNGNNISGSRTMIIFDTIGKNNPLAATQFAVLNAALLIPATYMQELDGIGYGWGGLTGNLLMDASLSLVTCGTLALGLSLLRRRALLTPDPVPVPVEEAVSFAPSIALAGEQ